MLWARTFARASLPRGTASSAILCSVSEGPPETPTPPALKPSDMTGTPPAILPNLGGSLPNDCFADVLGLPTIWVPHSYPACSQHAPNEHMLARVAREGLQIMTGLFWDLGASGTPAGTAARAAAQDRPGSV